MPPEVLIGFTDSTPKIDVWALGVMLHALITGRFPFRSAIKDELKKQIIEREVSVNRRELPISDNCLDLILRMLAKDPAKRISIREILDHPWIKKYKRKKRKREWGLFCSDSDESSLSGRLSDECPADKTTALLSNGVEEEGPQKQSQESEEEEKDPSPYDAKQRTCSILTRLGNTTNKLQTLRKKMTMDSNRNNSYSPDKINRFVHNTTTTGFNLTLKKTKRLSQMLCQDKTPNGGSTPADTGCAQSFGSYVNREGKSQQQSELKFPDIVSSSCANVRLTANVPNNQSFYVDEG